MEYTKSHQELNKLSYLIKQSKDKIKRIGFKPYVKVNKHKLQKVFKHTNNMMLSYITKSHKPNWSDMFRLDFTAQSLENLRRHKENKIFFRKMKQLHEKDIGIKLET